MSDESKRRSKESRPNISRRGISLRLLKGLGLREDCPKPWLRGQLVTTITEMENGHLRKPSPQGLGRLVRVANEPLLPLTTDFIALNAAIDAIVERAWALAQARDCEPASLCDPPHTKDAGEL